MSPSIVRMGIATAVAVSAMGSVAAAEPISVTYRIAITETCDYGPGGLTCSEYRASSPFASFPSTVTFDTQPTISYGNDLDRTRFYGAPVVSEIPLSHRADFPPLTETMRQAAERAQFIAEHNAWRRDSGIQIRYGASVDANDYHRDISLLANGEFATVPNLTGLTFAQFLGTAPWRQFAFSDAVELANGGFELRSFRGDVTLDSVVTPAPASLLLLGTGLAALGLRRRSRAQV